MQSIAEAMQWILPVKMVLAEAVRTENWFCRVFQVEFLSLNSA